ncbi:hypothetical protein Acr_02g0008280 [Actinidia rufa]|uniref:F-box domain-containing protein n=1 Tax=Actinidia rufa TaxID=165716 RepID=A0A7J0E814_9ERIC|nr:hypothetical protein Acr_02g0008280 [Actinidia rufa]
MMMDSQQLPILPHDLTVKILSRLPVNSLLQFACICKLWHSLISDPHFITNHLRLASTNTDYRHHRLILRPPCRCPVLNLCSLYSVLYEQSTVAVVLDHPFKGPRRLVKVVGTCNGFVWMGYGHDESVDDYKVVRVICGSDGAVSDQSEVKVHSTRTHSWRRIGDFPRSCRLKDLGKFVNEELHWIAYIAESIAWVVVSLDLGTERLGEVLEPDYRNCHFDGVFGCFKWMALRTPSL